MQKILLVTLEYPPGQGGIAQYLFNIYKGMPLQSFVVLAPPHKDAQNFDKDRPYKIYRRKLSVFWLWPRWRIIILYILELYFREHIREIHISHVLPVGYVAYICKKIFRVPYTVYTHGMDVLLPQKSAWKKFWLKRILACADRIIANSNFTKNEILKLGVEKQVEVRYPCVIPPAAHNDAITLQLQERYALADKKIILSVGRLVERKGFDVVLGAMPRIIKAIPQAIYVIVGSGPLLEKLRLMTHNFQLKDRVIFTNTVSDEELNAWYEICDVFAMPARQIGADVEGFGMVFLEAALHEKPSIGGRSGGVREAIRHGETGMVVDPTDIDEIAASLIQLLQDDTRRREMGSAAKQMVLENFTCSMYGNQKIY